MSKMRMTGTFTHLTTSRVTVEVNIGPDGVGIENDEGDLFVDNVFDRHLLANQIPGTTRWEFNDSTTTNSPGDYHFETIVRVKAEADDTLPAAKHHGPKKGKAQAARGRKSTARRGTAGKSAAAKKKKKAR
jgi:hypothetical protein